MDKIKITGIIKDIKYRNTDNWSVFSLKDKDNTTSCTGTLPSMTEKGHEVICEGIWTHNKFGKQLKLSAISPAPLNIKSDEGVIQLLKLLPGIGQVKAKSAVKELGAELAWKTANKHPSYLGISTIEQALDAQEKANSLIANYHATVYLLGIGLTENQTNKIIKTYGVDEAIDQVRSEPYDLINDIDGFGFRIVDGIALKAGLKANSDQRTLAGILYCLNDNEKNNGNIWFYGNALIKIVINELLESAMKQAVPAVKVEYCTVKKLIHQLAKTGRVFIDGQKVYSAELLNCEKTIYRAMG